MNIRFNPPHLEAARRSDTLCRLAEEMAPAEFVGELRVLQNFPGQPMRLVLISSGHLPASIEVPRSWLHDDLPETEMRTQLSGLFASDLSEFSTARWCAA